MYNFKNSTSQKLCTFGPLHNYVIYAGVLSITFFFIDLITITAEFLMK